MKRLLAWFRRISRQPAAQARKPFAAADHNEGVPEFFVPDLSDNSAQQQETFSSQENTWQAPACEAPSFDTSASASDSSSSSCDTSSYDP